jgi:hypothetical protein
VTSLTLTPGGEAELTASAVYNHLPVFAGPDQFRWDFEGSCGTLKGSTFYAGNPGTGTLTVSAGEKTVEIPVTVTKLPLKTVKSLCSLFSWIPYMQSADFWENAVTARSMVPSHPSAGSKFLTNLPMHLLGLFCLPKSSPAVPA